MSEICYRRSADAISTEPEPGKVVLLQLDTGQYHTLNAAGVVLWAALESPQSVDDLAGRLVAGFDIDLAVAEQDVQQFVADMLERKLIQVA